VTIQIHETHHGSFGEVNSLPLADFVQGGVDTWQMDGGDVADESADDFVIAHAAMQPAEKEHELYAGGNDGGLRWRTNAWA
jgi:hypothetical protein